MQTRYCKYCKHQIPYKKGDSNYRTRKTCGSEACLKASRVNFGEINIGKGRPLGLRKDLAEKYLDVDIKYERKWEE